MGKKLDLIIYLLRYDKCLQERYKLAYKIV